MAHGHLSVPEWQCCPFVSAIEGGKGKAFLPIRTIVQEALLHGYDRFLLLHNHPSGDPRPSRTDLQATRLLCRTARTLELELIDHLILASSGCFSFRDAGDRKSTRLNSSH